MTAKEDHSPRPPNWALFLWFFIKCQVQSIETSWDFSDLCSNVTRPTSNINLKVIFFNNIKLRLNQSSHRTELLYARPKHYQPFFYTKQNSLGGCLTSSMDHAFPNIKHNLKTKSNDRMSACDQWMCPSTDEGIFCAKKCSKIGKKKRSFGLLYILNN